MSNPIKERYLIILNLCAFLFDGYFENGHSKISKRNDDLKYYQVFAVAPPSEVIYCSFIQKEVQVKCSFSGVKVCYRY